MTALPTSARQERLPRPRADFVAKTIGGAAEAIEQAIFAEEHARRDGLLQRTDPRAKLIGLLLLILATGLVRHVVVVLIFYGIALALAVLSRISLDLFVKRVWMGIPFFAGIIALPALVLMPGVPLVRLLDVGPFHLAITDRSLASTVLFVARVGASVSLAVLLVMTTRWADLLKALRVLGVPEAFVVILGMTYRYIFLSLQSLSNLFLARKSRMVGRTSGGEQRRWVAASMGVLMSKTFKLSNDVYLAMLARGFTGEVHTLRRFQMRDQDWLFAAVLVAATGLGLLVDRGLG